MPFTHTCQDHPEWRGSTTEEAMAHLRDAHPGHTARAATDFIGSGTFQDQATAQGNPRRLVYRCRRCGAEVEAIATPDVEPSPYCENCEPADA